MDKGGCISFLFSKYIYAVIVVIIITSYLIYRNEKRFFTWVEEHFFFKRSLWSKASGFAFLLGLALLLFSLLDLRGKPIKINAEIPDQKTIIIIDASSSMLVEDVRPNRFQKSIIMARHFVKKSVGHQIAVVLFSDTQKRLVPFTDDLDLLDSRISGLASMDINRGGSNIDQAIQESIQYFKATEGANNDISGNLLIFTDSEDNGEGFKIDIPDTVGVAVVGVGTAKGGPIPIRNRRGVFRGYKKFKGQKVISKLDENYLKKLERKVKNLRYWIALSYTIPTEEILTFFGSNHKKNLMKGSTTVRPVLGNWLIVPGVVLVALSSLLKLPRSFSYLFILSILMFGSKSPAQENVELDENGKKIEEKKYEKEVAQYLELMKKGDLTKEGKLKLGEYYIKDKEDEKGLILYEENIKKGENKATHLFNYGAALLKAKKIKKGIEILNGLERSLPISEETEKIKKDIRQNILTALAQQQQDQQKQKQKKKQEKDEKEKKDKQDKKDNKDQKGGKKGKQKDKEKEDKDNKDKKDKDKKDEKDKEEEDKKKEEEKNEKGKKKEKKPKTLEEKERDLKKRRKMVKIPAMLKQIMNEDRELQEKYFKTNTRDKKNNRDKKDW